jgi:hypothetical protein
MVVEYRVWGFLWKKRMTVIRWYNKDYQFWTKSNCIKKFNDNSFYIFERIFILAKEREQEYERLLSEFEPNKSIVNKVIVDKSCLDSQDERKMWRWKESDFNIKTKRIAE